MGAHSDILTPLAALGVPFAIDDARGPVVENTVRSMEQVALHFCFTKKGLHEMGAHEGGAACAQVRRLHALDLGQLQFVGEALSILRQEVSCQVPAIPCFLNSTNMREHWLTKASLRICAQHA